MPRRDPSRDPSRDDNQDAKPVKGITAPRRDFWERRFDPMEEQKSTLAARKAAGSELASIPRPLPYIQAGARFPCVCSP